MLTVAVSVPPAFVAVTVNKVVVISTVGVPEIRPFEVSKDRPVGKLGAIDHVTTAPPPDVGFAFAICVPFVRM